MDQIRRGISLTDAGSVSILVVLFCAIRIFWGVVALYETKGRCSITIYGAQDGSSVFVQLALATSNMARPLTCDQLSNMYSTGTM